MKQSQQGEKYSHTDALEGRNQEKEGGKEEGREGVERKIIKKVGWGKGNERNRKGRKKN